MPGTEGLGDLGVVLGALIDVADEQADRRAGGAALVDARQDLNLVRLLPLRGEARLAGAAAIEKGLDVRLGQVEARRAAVNDGTDSWTVRLAPGGEAEDVAEVVEGHRPSPWGSGRGLTTRPTLCPGASSAFIPTT
jgi:hypothetical protein